MYQFLLNLHGKISLWKSFVHHPVEHVHMLQGVRVYPHYVFFHWDISVVCLTIISKLSVTVFISLYFHRFWPKWHNFFRSFQKHFDPWPKKPRAPFQKHCSMKPIRSSPSSSSSTCGCLLQEKYVADWKKETSHFKLATKKLNGRPPRLLRIEAGGAAHPPRYFAKRHPRVWANVVTWWFLDFISRDLFVI